MPLDPYQEYLDDSSRPFEKRWGLISELDRVNRVLPYRIFIKKWDRWFQKNYKGIAKISILEIGSGSGGLSEELLKWGRANNIQIDLHLYDSQEDILIESQKRFAEPKPALHVATDQHLKVYDEKKFDFVVSFQVLHHIRPLTIASDALLQMHRIARLGVFVADLEQRPFNVMVTRIYTFFLSVSDDLRHDGVNSVRRAYESKDLLTEIQKDPILTDFNVVLKRLFVPFFIFMSNRKN